jgi:hypothetical protein
LERWVYQIGLWIESLVPGLRGIKRVICAVTGTTGKRMTDENIKVIAMLRKG